MMIDQTYLIKTLTDLIAINSTNPNLGPDGAGEVEIARYIVQALQGLGLSARLQELGPRRANVIGILRGSGGGRSLMWNGHTDTVGINGMKDPFGARREEDRIYGRGSQDMKGSLAAMLAAAKSLQQSGASLSGDVILTFVCDEEHDSIGTEAVLKDYRADAAIVTEPTEMQLSLAHRGFVCMEVEVFGKAAHGSRYQEGIDAILMMGRFLHELSRLEVDLRQRQPHPFVGPPSLHASIIKGGAEMNTYPDYVYLMIDRRTIPGETTAQVETEIRAILERLASQDALFRYALRVAIDRPPFEIDPSAPIAQVVHSVLAEHTPAPAAGGVTFWTDAAILGQAGIPSIVIGPAGHGLHTPEEWVSIRSCIHLADVLANTARRFCG